MDKQDVYRFLSDPAPPGSNPDTELKELIGTYPYCSLLYLLLARVSQQNGDPGVQDVIEKAAVYLPDREGLYNFLHSAAPEEGGTAPAAEASPAPAEEAAAPEPVTEVASEPVTEVAPAPAEGAAPAPAEEVTPEPVLPDLESMPGEEVPDEEVLFGEITDDKTVAEEGADAETGLQKAGPRDIALSKIGRAHV